MPDPYFRLVDDGFLPGPHACGPWSNEMLHGRLLGGLAARALEAEFGGDGWRAARLTVDLFRPAPMDAVTVTTQVVRHGRRIKVGDATLRGGGNDVGRTTVVFLRTGEAPPGRVWSPSPWPATDPESFPTPLWREEGPPPAWEIRVAGGGFGTGERSRIWTRDTAALVDDEPLTPFVRAALAGDIASPLANGSDAGIHYINGDYTVTLARYPRGAWIGVEAAQHLAADGIALGACTLYDLDGPIGTSTATALATPALRPTS